MDKAINILIEVFTKNPLTVTLAVLGVLCIVIAIIGRIPPMELSMLRQIFLAALGVVLVSTAIGFAWILTPTQAVTTMTATPSQLLAQPTTVTQGQSIQSPIISQVTPTQEKQLPTEIFGRLLYEETNLTISPGHDAVPKNPEIYTDFIFVAQFYYVQNTQAMGFYLRQQRPPCSDTHWNCSIQVALDFTDNTVAARRFRFDQSEREIAKISTSRLKPNQSNNITITVKGLDYEVYINGFYVLGFNDSAYASGAWILDNDGRGQNEIKVDFIRIYEIR